MWLVDGAIEALSRNTAHDAPLREAALRVAHQRLGTWEGLIARLWRELDLPVRRMFILEGMVSATWPWVDRFTTAFGAGFRYMPFWSVDVYNPVGDGKKL